MRHHHAQTEFDEFRTKVTPFGLVQASLLLPNLVAFFGSGLIH